ncbi:chromatin remodeling protein EBS-like [Apium graveolens]|uniref:chromatin remodeling protein EBS-like n=1 Tax=Apium graveolens TaxID=4045 RepID=UPI003D7B84EE
MGNLSMSNIRKRKLDIEFYTISRTGETVRAGDSVLIESSEPHTRPSVGVIKKLESEKEGNITVDVRWYHRPEETSFGRRVFQGARELFLSDQYETLSANRIMRKCFVHSLKDYNKLEKIRPLVYYSRFKYKVGTNKFTPDCVSVYCKCEMPYNPDNLMIQCDDCNDWFHPGCVKMTTEQAEQLSNYICDECSS